MLNLPLRYNLGFKVCSLSGTTGRIVVTQRDDPGLRFSADPGCSAHEGVIRSIEMSCSYTTAADRQGDRAMFLPHKACCCRRHSHRHG